MNKRLLLALSCVLLAGLTLLTIASTYTSSDSAHRFNGTIYATDSSLAGTASANSLTVTNLGTNVIPSMVLSQGGSGTSTAFLDRYRSGAQSFWNYANINTASWAAGVVSVTCASTHYLTNNVIVNIVNVTPAGYNGTYRVASILSTTRFTYALAADPGAYSTGGYICVEPELQASPRMPNVPAMILSAHPDSVSLGLDGGLPVLGVACGTAQIKNSGWFIAADGHSESMYVNGVYNSFRNGAVFGMIPGGYIGWTGSSSAVPSVAGNIDIQMAPVAGTQTISLTASNSLPAKLRTTGNYQAVLSVGATTYFNAAYRSQTNQVAGALTFAHCTNGLDGIDVTTVRWLFNSSGSDQTLSFPIINTGVNGWRTNVYSAVPPAITNGTIMKVILDVGGPTDTLARQTNCYVKFEYYQ